MTIPFGYSMLAPSMADLDAVQRLIAAVDLAEVGESDADNDDLRLDWEKADLTRDARLVYAPDGTLVAYAFVSARADVRITADVYLHNDYFDRGIGTAINRFTEERAALLPHARPSGYPRHARHLHQCAERACGRAAHERGIYTAPAFLADGNHARQFSSRTSLARWPRRPPLRPGARYRRSLCDDHRELRRYVGVHRA